ncbi:MAG: hypothetical protein FH753_09100 [Firmicutes bacterium]|nr:hypothetical protein [Bacillota bacterium]
MLRKIEKKDYDISIELVSKISLQAREIFSKAFINDNIKKYMNIQLYISKKGVKKIFCDGIIYEF